LVTGRSPKRGGRESSEQKPSCAGRYKEQFFANSLMEENKHADVTDSLAVALSRFWGGFL
jgi:hypothetical protein